MSEKKLTVEDPFAPDVIRQLQELTSVRATLANQYVDLDNEKIRLQVAIRKLDEQKDRLMEKELLDRGLAPTTPIEIDAETGKITVMTTKPVEG